MSELHIQSTLVVGCGYIGTQVAQQELQQGRSVQAIVRDPQQAERITAQSIAVVVADLDQPSLPNFFLSGKGLYYFAPPPEKGAQDVRLENFLAQIPATQKPAKMLLISTTGVYGNCEGDWIDENTPLNPQADRAKRRVDAEIRLQNWCDQRRVPYIILRVPGIYAPPDHLPEERVRKALPVLRESESPWSNRIHAEDLVQICVGAMHSDLGNQIYNVSDGNPSTMTDYFNQVADYFAVPRPPQLSLAEAKTSMSAGMLSYLAESKRVRPEKLIRDLAYRMRYPSLKEGLARSLSI